MDAPHPRREAYQQGPCRRRAGRKISCGLRAGLSACLDGLIKMKHYFKISWRLSHRVLARFLVAWLNFVNACKELNFHSHFGLFYSSGDCIKPRYGGGRDSKAIKVIIIQLVACIPPCLGHTWIQCDLTQRDASSPACWRQISHQQDARRWRYGPTSGPGFDLIPTACTASALPPSGNASDASSEARHGVFPQLVLSSDHNHSTLQSASHVPENWTESRVILNFSGF